MTLTSSLPGRHSLARQALLGMALRITLIIIVATAVTYWHLHNTLCAATLHNLTNYVDLRGKAESEQFLLAERQTAMVRDEFLRRLRAMGDTDPEAEFARIFVREADGLIRVRPELNDHRYHATAYLRHDVPLTPDLRRRLLIGWQLLDQWGPMLVNRFFSGFMNMPEQLSINFCPTADWGRSATPDTDISIYETVWRASMEKNPMRLPFWTTVYYDPGAGAWMVSCVTPGDDHGRWLMTSGQDMEISDLIRRTSANHVEEGTWNFIVDGQGNLIAHPQLTEQIAKAGGNLHVKQLGDAPLLTMVKAVLANTSDTAHTLDLPGLDLFLGITRIKGPGWSLVTVYPKGLLTTRALATARIFLAVGLITLLVELLIMAVILRRRITIPIAQTVSATERISHGDFSVHLDSSRHDELGVLAAAVNRMATAMGERDAALNQQVSELKEAKQVQQEQQKRECIGTLAGGIAHDFNNILSAIIGYTDLALLRKHGDEAWQSDLREVHRAAARASALVRQILTFSRKHEQEKVPVQISLITKEALKLLRASIPSTIDMRQEITTQALVMADPTQIHQVIMNLCTNAYQAMMAQGGLLSVTLTETGIEPDSANSRPLLPPGRYVHLAVSDSGCGMDQETKEKIFDPYFTTKEPGKGTGLGLAVVHGIVESHHGRITVHSAAGQGATFHVYLPMIVRQTATAQEAMTPPPAMPQGHGRVMVADDEPQLRELACQVLTQAGYQVTPFGNGLEAWQALERDPNAWDLLITDQTMPEMTGDQLAAKALALRPGLPIILCSGYSATLDVEGIKKAGVFASLDKPLDLQALLAQTAKALAKS